MVEPVAKRASQAPDLEGSRAFGTDVDDVTQQVGGGLGVGGVVELRHGLLHRIREGHFTVRVAQGEEAFEAFLELGIVCGRFDHQELASFVEGVACSPTVPGALLLDPPTHLVDGQDGMAHDVEAVNDAGRLGGDHPKHRGVGLGHVEAPVVEPCARMWWGWARSQRATVVKSLVGRTSMRAWLATSHTVVDHTLCL